MCPWILLLNPFFGTTRLADPIMASGPITSWQIDRKNVERASDFIFLGSKINADGDCSHRIKRHLLLGRIAMTNLDCVKENKKQQQKNRDITLLINVHIVNQSRTGFSSSCVWMWELDIKKAEHGKIDTFKLWC